MHELVIFYDGACPLCLREMQLLQSADSDQKLHFEDINSKLFHSKYPVINRDRANRVLHGMLADGSIILGLDVTCKAWTLVGKGQWVSYLRWPLLKQISDMVYLVFAKYRYPISRLVTGQKRCDSCTLSSKTP